MFTKEERSGFKYWFAHWCAFQMTALNLKCWKFKYLFHDIEKPWLKLLIGDYSKVQSIRRKRNKHHIQYWIDKQFNVKKVDWEAMVIDWECSRFTKLSAQLNARDTLEIEFEYLQKLKNDNVLINDDVINVFRENIENVLNKLNL